MRALRGTCARARAPAGRAGQGGARGGAPTPARKGATADCPANGLRDRGAAPGMCRGPAGRRARRPPALRHPRRPPAAGTGGVGGRRRQRVRGRR